MERHRPWTPAKRTGDNAYPEDGQRRTWHRQHGSGIPSAHRKGSGTDTVVLESDENRVDNDSLKIIEISAR